MRWMLALVVSLASPIACETCPCGYALTHDDDVDDAYKGTPVVFTDRLVTDFAAWGGDISRITDWTRQQFNVSAEDGRGRFGKSFQIENVFLYAGASEAGHQDSSSRALGLRVGSVPTEFGAITAAEMDSARMDMFWGSYRAVMKLTRANGTCAAFFWYRNDSQEIDMEFLSREFDVAAQVFPVNLVIHSRESMRDGYDASKSGTLRRVELPFDPTGSFHEYRFDYLPGRVSFYADGRFLADMRGEQVPSSGGHVILQHWSNGNALWSGGPPSSDAVLLVRSVEAYFNSSSAQKGKEWDDRCSGDIGGKGREKTCRVPSETILEDGRSSGNSTEGNSHVDDEQSRGGHKVRPTMARLAYLMMTCAWLVVM
ncbi:hypothetical protein E4U41_006866 [Claviceps citrina]|nr:hypothetical protein E4U41_006866 [Claviceps citrina]